MIRYTCFATIIAVLFTFPDFADAQLSAMYAESPIHVDGVMNESAWQTAEPVSDFTQRELIEGAAPSEKTEVRFMFDDEAFYIGVICHDSQPDKIVHKELKRDGTLYRTEDNFTIVIDTYNDKRAGYYFAVNANGAKYDGTFLTYVSPNIQWDGIWDTSSRITADGWVCEIAIPFKTLRFPATPSQTWGINFRRQIRRTNEEIMWRGWRRDDDILHLSKAGAITLDRTLRQSRQLDFKPYALGGLEKKEGVKLDDTLKAGFDVKYALTSNTNLDVTVNTDFAQIESDREVINLSRYDISYPEKRDFFLADSQLFEFSQGMTTLFYSRRIGIAKDRSIVPILGGVKLTQKAGSYRLGVMSVQTDEQGDTPSTNYSVIRMKKDILAQSTVGFIATSIMDADGHDNQVYGVDTVLKTSKFLGNKTFEVQSYLTNSFTEGKGKDNIAGRIYISYPNDLISTFFVYHAIGPGFNPEMGFINGKKPGVHQYMYQFRYTPRLSSGFIKKLTFEPLTYNYYTGMNRKLTARTVTVKPFGFTTNSDDEFGITINNKYDFVENTYTIFDGEVPIGRGGYEWWEYQMNYSSSRSRTVAVTASAFTGGFYGGDRTNLSAECVFRTNMHYSLSADVNFNRIGIDNRTFNTREYGSRLTLDINTRLSSTMFLQWNNETREVNLNYRIRFIPSPGSDLYIVYNHLMDEEHEFETLRSTGMFKMNYTFRF
jgi:hypothetical protein